LPFSHISLHATKPKIFKGLSKPIKNPKTLGDKIRNRRIELGLLQNELAEMVGVSEDTIRNWEKNNCLPNSSNNSLLLLLFQK